MRAPEPPEEPSDAPSARRISTTIAPSFAAHRTLILAVTWVVAAVIAWAIRFAQDDAFISFRYSRNLAEGRGFVFNPGERVQGYTNFLWTLLMAVPERLGWSTPVFSQVIGILLMLATITVVFRFATRLFGDEVMAYLTVVCLIANASFIAYATGGLETMLQTFLIVCIAALLLPVPADPADAPANLTGRRALSGLLGGLAILTRLDSTVFVGALAAIHLFGTLRTLPKEQRTPTAARIVATVSVPLLVLVVPYLAWAWSYYGEPLPNTFFAKTGGTWWMPILFALLYLLVFGLWYAAFLLIGRWRRFGGELRRLPVGQVLWVVPVWILYMILVGADFMEFRFMVPIMPVLAMVAAFLVDHYTKVWRQVAVVAILLLASLSHLAIDALGYPVKSIAELRHWPGNGPSSLVEFGDHLADAFPGGLDEPDQVLMATGTLGVMPYRTDLPTIDLVGLTDAYVARHGEPVPAYFPGHVRIAPVDYVLSAGVNILAAVPEVVTIDEDREDYRLSELLGLYPVVDLKLLPDSTQIIEVPTGDGRAWLVMYVNQHDKVDDAIERLGWNVYPIERTCRLDDMPPLARSLESKTCDPLLPDR